WFSKPRPLIDIDTFDSATRTPIGAPKLLWALKGRHLASLGAFLVLAILTISTFVQNVINYSS
ncbi:hypothetical protein AOQ84DRAFT_274231, partial [Glonium stellatum]